MKNKLQFLRSGANFDNRFCKPLILLHSLKALTFCIFKFERGYILLPLSITDTIDMVYSVYYLKKLRRGSDHE